jgi:hypothetical protein
MSNGIPRGKVPLPMKIQSAFWKVCLVSLVMVGGRAIADPNTDYSNGVIPTPPCPFPEQFKDYQILPSSISPDGQYALIYPKRSVLYDLKEYSLYLVSLNPFRILTLIPLRWSNLAENAHGWFQVNWSKDSMAVVMIEGSKWGADKVYLTTIRNGNVGTITDLTEKITFEVDPDFTESKASRFNYCHDFLFYDSYDRTTEWNFINNTQVQINIICTSDPVGEKERAWTVRFQGVWDISQGKFTSKKITPLPKAP